MGAFGLLHSAPRFRVDLGVKIADPRACLWRDQTCFTCNRGRFARNSQATVVSHIEGAGKRQRLPKRLFNRGHHEPTTYG
jgi:hypothetical protein